MKTTYLLLISLLILVACESTPEPVTQNADWEPIAEDFNGVSMVQVPAGCFTMGHENGRRDEQPEHEICFKNPFWIDQYEVSNATFGSIGAFEGDTRPRENLTWFEARDHCAVRGARLPTEAEWEYAARGVDGLIYPWGNNFIDANLTYDANFQNQTSEVGSRPDGVSWVGAYDMAGNVWEWVSSLYHPYPYDADHESPDNTQDRRIYRGGLGNYIDYGTSGATRFRASPDYRDWFIGFRCAKDDD